jgi:ribosomal protein S18 acetylase RimI-like enzyme
MSGSSDGQDEVLLRRLIEFELDRAALAAERVEPHDWGRLITSSATLDLWSDNFLEVTADVDADRLAAIAEQLLGGRGATHRYVVPRDPLLGEMLEPRFRELGWQVDRTVYLVLRRDPDRQGRPATEVERAAVEELRTAVGVDDMRLTHDAVMQRHVRDARVDRVAGGRWFAAPADGEPAAACVLYERDGIGQVENVATRPDRRGKGHASAVVLAAARASREAGHDLTFIAGDANDWPWKLYERLGFDRIGEDSAFLRKPDQLRESP